MQVFGKGATTVTVVLACATVMCLSAREVNNQLLEANADLLEEQSKAWREAQECTLLREKQMERLRREIQSAKAPVVLVVPPEAVSECPVRQLSSERLYAWHLPPWAAGRDTVGIAGRQLGGPFDRPWGDRRTVIIYDLCFVAYLALACMLTVAAAVWFRLLPWPGRE